MVEQEDWKTLNQHQSTSATSSTAVPELIRSDLNLDGVVTAADQAQVLGNLDLELPAGDPAALCN
jgi:hypothetical protein